MARLGGLLVTIAMAAIACAPSAPCDKCLFHPDMEGTVKVSD